MQSHRATQIYINPQEDYSDPQWSTTSYKAPQNAAQWATITHKKQQ